jgi:hypothetical protein
VSLGILVAATTGVFSCVDVGSSNGVVTSEQAIVTVKHAKKRYLINELRMKLSFWSVY